MLYIVKCILRIAYRQMYLIKEHYKFRKYANNDYLTDHCDKRYQFTHKYTNFYNFTIYPKPLLAFCNIFAIRSNQYP